MVDGARQGAGGDALETAVEAAARYAQAVRRAPGPGARVRALADREGLRAVDALRRSLPAVPAPFSDTAAGHELRAWFGPGRLLPLDRAPVALLRLPATHADYLRGRPRQALRTNLTRAGALGLACAPAASAEEVWNAVGTIAAQRGQAPEHVVLRRPRPGLVRHFTIARDAGGAPVALAETIVDGPWAGLAALVSAHGHQDALLARYLLHTEVVRALVDRGVSSLVVGGSMLLVDPGTRYFQRRLGYEPVALRPTPLPRTVARSLRLSGPPSLSLADLVSAVVPSPAVGELSRG